LGKKREKNFILNQVAGKGTEIGEQTRLALTFFYAFEKLPVRFKTTFLNSNILLK